MALYKGGNGVKWRPPGKNNLVDYMFSLFAIIQIDAKPQIRTEWLLQVKKNHASYKLN